jgi:hypothetical protein
MRYHASYRLTETAVEIVAEASGMTASGMELRFILPVISPTGEAVERLDSTSIRIAKPAGALVVRTDAPQGFEAMPAERTFNLVPGFECVPLTVVMQPGKAVRIRLEAAMKI